MSNKKENTEWNLSSLASGDDDQKFEENRKIWKSETLRFVEKWKDNKDYLKDPKVLSQALKEYELWEEKFGLESNEIVYFWLRSETNQTDTKIKSKFNKVEEFAKELGNQIIFFELSLGKIPESEQEKFLSEPELKEYKHFLKKIFASSKHQLSEKEEKILNLKSTPAQSLWIKLVEESISKEEREVLNESNSKEKKSFEEIMTLVSSQNKEVRDKAAESLNEILKEKIEIAEAEINAILADKKINDSLRGFSRPDEARHISDDIETEIVDSLIEAVSSQSEISKKFYELKAKLLGLSKLKYHERNVPYGNIEKEYSYEESVELVEKVFSKLDPKFNEIFKSFQKNGQIDVYPRKGKSGGAFCAHFLKSQPTFMLLNHTNKLQDVQTLAHELGHGINNELIKEKQNALNFGTTVATAEVASTFMEDFILEEIMLSADDELRLALYMQKLNGDISSIFRQVACYKFEQELHEKFREKGHLSQEEIGNIFQENMKNYMGSAVDQSPGSQNWWIYWSHIRRFFYVYSYASGLLISKSLQSKVRENPKFIEKVKEFLSAGTSKSPKEIFQDLGIDITQKEFFLTGLKEISSLLEKTEELAKKLGKI
ncbi:MAG: M3 family oligoendopeptidase [Nanoarchaeota archaeon]|nr:M3 family oligoendopeptidase [Nanoarchaeota archaeon]